MKYQQFGKSTWHIIGFLSHFYVVDLIIFKRHDAESYPRHFCTEKEIQILQQSIPANYCEEHRQPLVCLLIA